MGNLLVIRATKNALLKFLRSAFNKIISEFGLLFVLTPNVAIRFVFGQLQNLL